MSFNSWSNELHARHLPAGKDVNTEAEESTMMGTPTYQQLEKINWDDYLCALMISPVHELAKSVVADVIIIIILVMIYNCSMKPIINPNLMSSH
jgi:hypothetical protein